MSCAVFTAIGIYAAAAGKSNGWIVSASATAAIGLFLVAAFLAWNDEHQAKNTAEKQLRDEQPVILFGLLSEPDWATLDTVGEYVFTLTNLGKRHATHVQIEPITSVSEALTIRFQCEDVLLADGHYRPIQHEIDNGTKRGRLDKRMLWEFLHNCPVEQQLETFNVIVKFRDMNEDKQANTTMLFDLNSKKLTIVPTETEVGV